jgi:eukaryotic-like serine/threonine-protein kinase
VSRKLSDHVMRRLIDLASPLGSDRSGGGEAGTDPGNKFEIVREVGRGGMGTVYEAVYRGHEHMRTALKVLSAGEVADFELRQWFADEARVASRLAHPNIPRIFEIHRTYIAMQFIDGVTMAQMPRTDRARLVRLLRDAALAVHYAHQQGLVHRDIKPQNLMVAAGDQVFVMDFGLAKRVHATPRAGEAGRILGTPVYMAPEQAAGRGDLVDARSDVYSLGATMYEMLCDKPPFLGSSREEVLRRVAESAVVDLCRIAPGVDRGLGQIVMDCLEKDPERRPQTAFALGHRLSGWLAKFTVPGR